MGIDDVFTSSDVVEENKIHYYIKEKMMMFQKCTEENDTCLPIMLFPDIIQCITPYIGNINYWFEIVLSNYWVLDK